VYATQFLKGLTMSTAVLAPTIITLQYADGPGINTTMSKMLMPFGGRITSATVCVASEINNSENPTDVFLSNIKVGSNIAASFSVPVAGTSAVGVLSSANCNFLAGDLVSFNAGAKVNGATGITVAFTVIES
jgi:hypothetical protein